jgi:hypothetical protein
MRFVPNPTEEQRAMTKALAVIEKQNAEFDPTIRTEPDELERAYEAARELVQSRAKLSANAKDFATAIFPSSVQAARLARKSMLNLKRAIRLRDKFGWKVVKIDDKTTRKAKARSDMNGRVPHETNIPLVWRSKIPAPAKVSIQVNGYNISTRTPAPTPEAEKVCREHRHRFSWLEVAWVPKDENLFAVPIPKPDPVLVGALDLGNGRAIYLELTRWVDETVESAYWSKEAY